MLGICRIPLLIFLAALCFFPHNAYAYIGPGAGFAFLGSAFVFLLTFVMAFITIAFWPLQWLYRKLLGKKISKNARTRRIVIVGLDGVEPKLAERLMDEGKLPNLKALAEEGSYNRLGTTLPALSPVAWSTFQTGVNPGAHNIFDFLTRDKRHCLPQLSSTNTELAKKGFSFGKLSLTRDKAKVNLLRKSQPFWKILGKNGIFSNIIRVPISYPPEKFGGNILSAMCVPDLKGTQGSFSVFTTKNGSNGQAHTGGTFQIVKRAGNKIEGYLEGPPSPHAKDAGAPLQAPFKLTLKPDNQTATLKLGDEETVLKLNEFSPWVKVPFQVGVR
ncbi:alkaline phosphatase family protein, partial [Oligoflexia bacterium]|nr:alkaline phosphatase family protein [Oligoflexia bacterium]